MRTRKLLGVLLAVVMAFGALGVSASALAADDIAAQASIAIPGWVTSQAVELDVSFSGWDKATVSWKMFTATKTSPSSNGTGYAQQASKSFAWNVWYAKEVAENTPGAIQIPGTSRWVERGIKYTLQTSATAANASGGSGMWYASNSDELQLYITAGTTLAKVYDFRIVELEVTAKNTTGTEAMDYAAAQTALTTASPVTNKSQLYFIELKSDSPLRDKISDAKKEAAKSDRYTKEYRAQLNQQIAYAEQMLSMQPTPEQVAETIAALDAAMAGEDVIAVGKRVYQLSTWDLLDNFLGDGVMKFIWSAIDFVMLIVNIYQAVQVIFGPIGDFFKVLVSIFGFLFAFIPI